MMDVCHCPEPDQLRAFVCGDLDSEEIDRHLRDCAACRRSAGTLDESSTLARWLRPVTPETPPADPLLNRLTSHVKAFGRSEARDLPGIDEAMAKGETALGEYELLEPIARGGMGWVFKAMHRRMKRIVAVKTVAPALADREEAWARFQREVEALARLSHPHIVAAHDAFDVDGRRFLVMEYVAGVGLDRRVREQGPLSQEQAIDYTLQAARGLAHAHAAGIVHRDVKPGNLLLDPSGTVKVLDLGLARLAPLNPEANARELTGATGVMGTAEYMAPEQALEPQHADARADVYALGCTLHFLLTGRPPFRGDSLMALLLAHRDDAPPSIRKVRPDCPPALDALCRRMLAKRPADRPASMGQVIAELERIRSGKATPPPTRRRALLAACVLLAVVGLAVPVVLPSPGDPPPAAPGAKAAAPAPAMKSPRIDMVSVEAGEFYMGSAEDDRTAEADEKPRHAVRITRPFLLGRFEITQEQYEAVMGVNPSGFSTKGRSKDQLRDPDTRKHPVESVSWMDAVVFCNRLSEKHGLEPYYRIEATTVSVRGGKGYRLPTEAEWEYSCRAGSVTAWASGDDARSLDEYAWHAGNSGGRTHAVGTRRANARGLHDMHGNVPEWCWDRYDPGFYRVSPVSDPGGSGKGYLRVYRGGGWNHLQAQTRSAARGSVGLTYSVVTAVVGLRVARDQ